MLTYGVFALGFLLFFVALPIYVTAGTCAICTRKILPWQSKCWSGDERCYHEICYPVRNKTQS